MIYLLKLQKNSPDDHYSLPLIKKSLQLIYLKQKNYSCELEIFLLTKKVINFFFNFNKFFHISQIQSILRILKFQEKSLKKQNEQIDNFKLANDNFATNYKVVNYIGKLKTMGES